MYNINFIEENLDILKKTSAAKGISLDFEEFKQLNKKRKELKKSVDELRRVRNKESKEVGALKTKGKDASKLISKLEKIKKEISIKESKLKDTQEKVNEFISWLPNLIDNSVKDKAIMIQKPVGLREFNFKPLDHIELGGSLGILDFEGASLVAGSNFALYKDKGATLERALINFMLDFHIKRHGYKEIFPPFLANEDSMFNTGQLPKMRDDMYITKRDGFFLNPTAEVPITNILADRILTTNELPIKYCGYTACFRREAGSYGKETRGLQRIHQFNKVELVNFVHPERSGEYFDKLLREALDIIEYLDLPYRVIQLPKNDLSFASSITYDIEVYAPGVDRWFEVSSVSNFRDFQAKRAQIRIQEKGDMKYIHTLNASGVATPRLMISLIENYQTKKGDINIPPCLVPYTNFDVID